jgi:PAS domain S-box-containing protein
MSTTPKRRLRALLVEDNEEDAILLCRELERAGYALSAERVDTAPAMEMALKAKDWDIVLSDYSMPSFGAVDALDVLHRVGRDIPFLIISGTVGEETAVTCLRAGARDFLVKGRLARLQSAIDRELQAASSRHAQIEEERKNQALAKARDQAEDRLRLVIDASSNAMIIVDGAGAMTLVNARTEVMFGHSRVELLGKPVEILVPERLRSAARGTVLFGKDVASTNRESHGLRRDGTEVPVEVDLIPFRTGEGSFILASIVDITDRKRAEEALRESEQRFRQIAESINEVFWMTDVEKNQMLYISPGYEKIWGRSCASIYEAPETWLDAIHAEDRERVSEAATTKQKAGEYHEVYRVIRPDGSTRWIRDRAFPIRDAEGRVFRVTGIAEDITTNRSLEEQVRKAQKMEAIGTLAGGIAHDFNNILAAITGYSALARTAAAGNEELLEYVGEINRAGLRGADLVKQILAFSRQQEQKRGPVALRHVVSESLKLLRATIPATVEFRTHLPSDVPSVMADATQVHQVVMNLGTNAWHAMRDRPGVLDVRLEVAMVDAPLVERHPNLKRGRYVCLSVTDTGHGMEEATRLRIFEPFFTTKAPGEGTGLGLAVVHGIMAGHEGAIDVRSEVGKGTEFHLYFPAVESRSETRPQEVAPAPRGRGERILVVDDEEPLARLGKKILDQLGYAAEIATSAGDALALLRRDPTGFDLVVTDHSMPRMTGIDLARQLSLLRPGLPIILTSGHEARIAPEEVARLGVRAVLVKPTTREALAETIHGALAAPADGVPHRKSPS